MKTILFTMLIAQATLFVVNFLGYATFSTLILLAPVIAFAATYLSLIIAVGVLTVIAISLVSSATGLTIFDLKDLIVKFVEENRV